MSASKIVCIGLALAGIVSAAEVLGSELGQEGHGGDSYSAEFAAIGDELVTEIGGLPVSERYGVNPIELAAAIDNTEVDSTDTALNLNGRKVDAINYPDRSLIVLSRKSWDGMSFFRRQLLVLHEFCSILGVDDENYRVSAMVVVKLGPETFPAPNPSPSTWPSPDPSPSP